MPTQNPQAAVNDFLRFISAERGLARNTVDAYRRDIVSFISYSNIADFKIVTSDTIVGYLSHLRSLNRASSSVARALIAIKVFFRFLKREGYIPVNIAQGLETSKIWQIVPQVLSAAEVERFLQHVKINTPEGARDRAIFELLYGSGLRVSEVCTLNIHDVDDHFVKVLGKGGKQRMVPIGKHALKAIDHYLGHFRGECKNSDTDPLFISKTGKRIDRQNIWAQIKLYAKLAGIKKALSPHGLRHAFATHLLDNGADLRVIQEMMGHSHISSTDRYMHVSRKRIWEKFFAHHPRA